MKACLSVLLFAAVFSETWRVCISSCVLESDFGFVINCAFKKSSLFRIRNLGGVKAHISWGLSIGDELGFKESISNLELNKRREVSGSKLQAQLLEAQHKQDAQKKKPLTIPSPAAIAENISSEDSGKTSIRSSITTKDSLLSTTTLPKIQQPLPSENSAGVSESVVNSGLQILPSINDSISNHITTDKSGNDIVTKPTRKRQSKSKSSRKRPSHSKILVAPKEYHPIGYSKTFDESNVSRIRLPMTTFQCKDQLYFPGLYADENLGCMVFHVCVLTDTGMANKTFMCPESTLFDQSILRCNWWFYVDCKQSKQKFDTNIPVARSYQLIRALAAIVNNRRLLEGLTNTKDKEKQSV